MDKSSAPFSVVITNVSEIRMGSPYNTCHIQLAGFDQLQLPASGWQDKYAWADDFGKLVLIQWDFERAEPGFRLFLIDTATGTCKESPRQTGLPRHISLTGNKIQLTKFQYNKEKSGPNGLCCEIDATLEFTDW